tara:strand:+ start:98498 stop:98797 length:300 start_codon:yes stop_codon:yes gene_type:complete
MKKQFLIYPLFLLVALSSCEQRKPEADQMKNNAMRPLEEEVVLYERDPNHPSENRGLGSLADPKSTESMSDSGIDRNDELIPEGLYRQMNPTGATLAQF